MKYSSAKIKGLIKKITNNTNADPRIVLRIYMMERFLERLSLSKYKDNFVIKGGMLVSSMVGVSHRSTLDIDASITNIDLDIISLTNIVKEIFNIDVDDGVSFELVNSSEIMEGMDYSGIRLSIRAIHEKMVTPFTIDVSTNDVVTPRAINYDYKLLIEDRSIKLWSYNLETILSEKLHSILSKSKTNTRMRDFYDIYLLLSIYENMIDYDILSKAFKATCHKRRDDNLLEKADSSIGTIKNDNNLKNLWLTYQKRNPIAEGINYSDLINSIIILINYIK